MAAAPGQASGMSVRVKELLEVGVTPGRVRRMLAPYWGLREHAKMPDDIFSRCEAFKPRLGAACYSHATAAMLWGLPLPLRIRQDPRLHVAFARGHRAPRAAGVVGHELNFTDRVFITGLPATTPDRTWRDLGTMLDVPHLVAAGDALLRSGMARVTDLDRQSASRGIRSREKLRTALLLLDPRSESPQESLLRVALVRAGLPELLVNHDLRDEGGAFVARVDLRFRDYPVVVEFDGDGHRTDRAQWIRDVGRHSAIQDLGLDLVRALGDDSPSFPEAIDRTRARLLRHGWTPRHTRPSRTHL